MEKHKVHLWQENGDWHWLHNHGATSHEGKGFGSRDAALTAATADLKARVAAKAEPERADVAEVEA
jgi:hypothetical protein